MKIKEVCIKTGVTEKTVRYYIDCGLLSPTEYNVRGRTYREYENSDIEDLKNILALRNIGMSIELIQKMVSDGKSIPLIMNDYIERLSFEVREKQEILENLQNANFEETENIAQLVPKIKEVFAKEITPPDFKKLDEGFDSFEERELMREKIFKKGKRLSHIFMTCFVIGSLMAALSKFGLILYILVGLLMLNRKSGNLSFYMVTSVTALVANIIPFINVVGEIGSRKEIWHFPLVSEYIGKGLFLGAIVVIQAVSVLMLIFSKNLREYLNR